MRGRRRTLPGALAGTDARTLALGRGGASLDWGSAREVSDRPHNSKQNVVGLPTAVASALITRNAHVRLLRLILQCALVASLATRYSANIKWFLQVTRCDHSTLELVGSLQDELVVLASTSARWVQRWRRHFSALAHSRVRPAQTPRWRRGGNASIRKHRSLVITLWAPS